MGYKISYITTLVVLVFLVSTAYIMILTREKKSRLIRAGANPGSPAQWGLSLKISLIIVSQLITWASYIVAAVYFSFKVGVPDSFVEAFATIVVPSNSLLNPIFYSDDFRKIGGVFKGIRRKWDKVITKKENKIAT